jgi:hypothetical protein
VSDKRAEIALEFLKHFYLSDIGDDLKQAARKVLLGYLAEKGDR